MKRGALVCAILLIAASSVCHCAAAADRNWMSSSGMWTSPDNWSGTVVPTIGDIAYIDNGGMASLPVGYAGTTSTLFVGHTTAGSLGVAGGTLTGVAASLGFLAGASGTAAVSGPGAVWNLDSSLIVGNYGAGEITIDGGAMLCNYDFGWLAAYAGSQGTITVDGEDSLWQTSLLNVGMRGVGTLNITGGAEVICYYSDIGLFAGGQGLTAVDGAGSSLTDTGNLAVGVNGSGTLRLTNGGSANIGGLLAVGEPGTIEGDGNVYGNVFNGGLIAPGMSAGVLQIAGDLMQGSTGTIGIELAGTALGDAYDQLIVTGMATLDGVLKVSLIDGFVPVAGSEFHVLNLASHSGEFADVNLPALGGGLSWDRSRLYSDGLLAVLSEPGYGDLNDDGFVDAADVDILWSIVRNGGADPNDDDVEDLNGDNFVNEDDVDYLLANLLDAGPNRSYGDADLDGGVGGLDFTAWRLRAGTGWAHGDFDGDGGIGGLDFTLWRTRPTAYPDAIGPHGGSIAPVPEPASLMLAVIAGLGVLGTWRLRSRSR